MKINENFDKNDIISYDKEKLIVISLYLLRLELIKNNQT